MSERKTRQGLLAATGCYLLWGFLPLYWKQLQHIPALEILIHRMVWSFVFVVILLSLRKNWSWLHNELNPKTIGAFILSGLLLALNWFLYIWAVNNGHIIETSLGYFINPLVNVALGIIVLGERLRSVQWLAILLATTGVLYLTFMYGSFPWIAITLAFSFGIYGLLRKTAKLGSLQGLSLETAIFLLPALGYLAYLNNQSQLMIGQSDATATAMLIGAGVVTSIPLLLFAYGAQRITLATLGILQYLAPSIQFLIGWLVYDEPFPPERFIGFAFIWLGLLIYTSERVITLRNVRRELRLDASKHEPQKKIIPK